MCFETAKLFVVKTNDKKILNIERKLKVLLYSPFENLSLDVSFIYIYIYISFIYIYVSFICIYMDLYPLYAFICPPHEYTHTHVGAHAYMLIYYFIQIDLYHILTHVLACIHVLSVVRVYLGK